MGNTNQDTSRCRSIAQCSIHTQFVTKQGC